MFVESYWSRPATFKLRGQALVFYKEIFDFATMSWIAVDALETEILHHLEKTTKVKN